MKSLIKLPEFWYANRKKFFHVAELLNLQFFYNFVNFQVLGSDLKFGHLKQKFENFVLKFAHF